VGVAYPSLPAADRDLVVRALDLGEEETALERGEEGDSEVVRVGALQGVPGLVKTAQPVADRG